MRSLLSRQGTRNIPGGMWIFYVEESTSVQEAFLANEILVLNK
jgi:hypothetical protein